MTRQNVAAASSLLLLLFAATAVWMGSLLPAHTPLPVDWGLDGEVRVVAGKWTALTLGPVLILLNSLFFYALPAIEPYKTGLARSQRLYLTCWVTVLLYHLARELVVISHALGWTIPIDRLVIASIGLMFILVGDQIGKSRRMVIIGIVTPWTLASEGVWIRTHRFAGRLMAIGGLAILAGALLALQPEKLRTLSLGVLVITAVVPTFYSYLIWVESGGATRNGPTEVAKADGHKRSLLAYTGSIAFLLLLCGQIIGSLSQSDGLKGLIRTMVRLIAAGLPYIFAQ